MRAHSTLEVNNKEYSNNNSSAPLPTTRSRVARRVKLNTEIMNNNMSHTTHINNNNNNNNNSNNSMNKKESKNTDAGVNNIHRVMSTPNTVVVLHVKDAPIMSIDLCCSKQIDTNGRNVICYNNINADEFIIKSMAREANEPAVKTLDRVRLLFAPKVKQSITGIRKGSYNMRDKLLANCPTVKVLGVPINNNNNNNIDFTSNNQAAFTDIIADDKSNSNSNSEIKIQEEYVELDVNISNALFWSHARVLCIGEIQLCVKYNIPTILSLTPPNRPLVGLPLVCSNIKTLFTDHAMLRYEWCLRTSKSEQNKTKPCNDVNSNIVCNVELDKPESRKSNVYEQNVSNIERKRSKTHSSTEFLCLSTEPYYIPPMELLHKRLTLRLSLASKCLTSTNTNTNTNTNINSSDFVDDNFLWTEVELNPVELPPTPVARWEMTHTHVTPPAFRVITYNILYDSFCTSRHSKERIYPFATDEVLNIENRQVRILQELLAYHGDIVCLQECGMKLYESYLEPALHVCGYDGVYANKSGLVHEGCALFYRRDRFKLEHTRTVNLNWETLSNEHNELACHIERYSALKDALEHMTNIGCVYTLRELSTNQELVVGNTHLFYHANGCHIRILQAYVFLSAIYKAALLETKSSNEERVLRANADECISVNSNTVKNQSCCMKKREEEEEEKEEEYRPIVICGDFNCTHETGAYQLLTTSQVEKRHHSWEKGELFWWGCDRLLGCTDDEIDAMVNCNDHTTNAASSSLSPSPPPPPPTTLSFSSVVPTNIVDKNVKEAESAQKSETSLTEDESQIIVLPQEEEQESEEQQQQQQQQILKAKDNSSDKNYFCTTLQVPLTFVDTYHLKDPSMPWTNYTMHFREVIDYIFCSKFNINVLRTIPIPPETELAENFALPNAKYPSDHVALIADLQLNTLKQK